MVWLVGVPEGGFDTYLVCATEELAREFAERHGYEVQEANVVESMDDPEVQELIKWHEAMAARWKEKA